MCDLFSKSLPGENPEMDISNIPMGHIPQESLGILSTTIPPLGEVEDPHFREKATLAPTPKYINTILPLNVRTTSALNSTIFKICI